MHTEQAETENLTLSETARFLTIFHAFFTKQSPSRISRSDGCGFVSVPIKVVLPPSHF